MRLIITWWEEGNECLTCNLPCAKHCAGSSQHCLTWFCENSNRLVPLPNEITKCQRSQAICQRRQDGRWQDKDWDCFQNLLFLHGAVLPHKIHRNASVTSVVMPCHSPVESTEQDTGVPTVLSWQPSAWVTGRWKMTSIESGWEKSEKSLWHFPYPSFHS